MMRNLKSKLQPAVFHLWYETWKTNWNQHYLIYDAKLGKQTAASSIYFMMRNLKTNFNHQYLIYDAKPENQTAISSI